VDGQWFNGKDFLRRTFYCVEGKLATSAPSSSLNTVDLQGGFVVPPFGDAHNHFPSGEQDFAEANRAHLKAGVFYTLNPGGNAEIANPIRPKLNTPATVDAIFAHGVFTCSDGHPCPFWSTLRTVASPSSTRRNSGTLFLFCGLGCRA
jgi:hypothetical protein